MKRPGLRHLPSTLAFSESMEFFAPDDRPMAISWRSGEALPATESMSAIELHNGLKSDIAPCPLCAMNGLTHCKRQPSGLASLESRSRSPCPLPHSIELEGGLGSLWLQSGEACEASIKMLPGTAVNTGLQQQKSYCRNPR